MFGAPTVQLSSKGSKADSLRGLLKTLWQQQQDTDVVFKCADGSVGAHKAFVKLLCPRIGELMPYSYDLLSGGGPAAVILVPGFSVKVVQSFIRMLYTGTTGRLTMSELRDVQTLGHTHLGFIMVLNWNISVEVMTSNNGTNVDKPVLPIPTIPEMSSGNFHDDLADQCSKILSSKKVAPTEVVDLASPRKATTSNASTSTSTDSRLVIDDAATSSPLRPRWSEPIVSVTQFEPERLMPLVDVGDGEISSDPMYDAESENDYYDQQDYDATVGMDPLDENGEKMRRKRTSISKENLIILRSVFRQEPFPNRATIDRLSEQVGLPFRVVRVWFQNERAKKSRNTTAGNGSSGRNGGNVVSWLTKFSKAGGSQDMPLELHSDHESSGTLDGNYGGHSDEFGYGNGQNGSRKMKRFPSSPGLQTTNHQSQMAKGPRSVQHEAANHYYDQPSPINNDSRVRSRSSYSSSLKRGPSGDMYDPLPVKREPPAVDDYNESDLSGSSGFVIKSVQSIQAGHNSPPAGSSRPFHCNWSGCTKTFRHSEELHRHVLDHTAQATLRLPCVECGQVFHSSEELVAHHKSHF